MTLLASFWVSGQPIAQPRPRACIRGRHASVYEAARGHPIHTWKDCVRLMAMAEWRRREPSEDALRVEMVFRMPSPKKPKREGPHTQKPDGDNLGKAILDSLRGVIFADDAQVAQLECRKEWAPKESAGVRVEVFAL